MNTSAFFDAFYNNAKENSVIVMETDGTFIKVNDAFTMTFKYTMDDLKDKNFRMLFIETDKQKGRPERELLTAKSEGSAGDDNFLLHKDGNQIWVTGESILVKSDEDEEYIVKIIHNIHAQKQLQQFLLESNEFIQNIFDSVNDVGLMIVSNKIKIVKINRAFAAMFNLSRLPAEGSRLSEIDNPFWKNETVRKAISDVIVKEHSLKDQAFEFSDANGLTKSLNLSAKLIEGNESEEKNILIIVKHG